MKLIRAFQLYLSDNGGFAASAGKVARLTWKVLRQQGVKKLLAEVCQTYHTRQAQALRHSQMEALGAAFSAESIAILATPHTLYVAYMLDQILSDAGYRSEVLTSVPARGFGKALVLVICPQMFSRLPRNMIAFQMEQTTSMRWFTRKYLSALNRSIAVFDYSRMNISNLQEMGVPLGSVFYLPIGIIRNYREYLATRGISLPWPVSGSIDVIFYGDVHNERRQIMLKELSRHFFVKVISNLFGAELYRNLLQARVVVNIHYYENALLETTRIFECLSLGLPVVSETSIDCADYPELGGWVQFVELGDATGMVAAVRSLLSEKVSPGSMPHAQPDKPSPAYYLDRFLLANDLLDFDKFLRRHPMPGNSLSERVCLSLPETPERRTSFKAQALHSFKVFDGLRHAQGWLGCGMSYKYLLSEAQRAGLPRITICEDDVIVEHPELLNAVDDYLNTLHGEWDVFVGLLTHLSVDAVIQDVTDFKGLTFVHLNTMTGMVLNVYNQPVYDLISSWNPSNRDPRTNTIDRFLEGIGSLRVVTALPFVAGHAESASSTLWGIGNDKYTGIIKESERLLTEKVAAFRRSRTA